MTANRLWRLSSAKVPLLMLMLLGPGSVNAQAIVTSASLQLDFNASGECQLLIAPDEPYSHLNSECNLFELDGETVVRQNNNPNLSGGFNIGNPPRTQQVFSWTTLLVGTNPGENFCQEFGSDDPTFTGCPPEISPPISMTFGHWQDPNGNIIGCGKKDCAAVPPLVTPLSPASVNGRFRGCRWGFAKHSLYISSVANASWYRVYADPGSGYRYEYSTASPTSTYVANGTAHIKAEACNTVGCSAISFDSYYSIWPCSLQ